MPRLEVVQTLTAGVDHVRDEVPEGVLLCNGRGIHNASTAELALTLTLASLRDIPGFVADQHEGRWNQGWRPSLADSTVLIVGYGDIGRDVERRLEPVRGRGAAGRPDRPGRRHTPRRPARPAAAGRRGHPDRPGHQRDHGASSTPASSAAMKQGALLVNVARGPVVVTDDLVAALAVGRVRAALDVTDPEPLPAEHPLWSAPNVLITPHVGGATPAMWPRAHRLVREQLERFAAGEPVAERDDGGVLTVAFDR